MESGFPPPEGCCRALDVSLQPLAGDVRQAEARPRVALDVSDESVVGGVGESLDLVSEKPGLW